jgi:membrane protein DedA with SNARE-associated domain
MSQMTQFLILHGGLILFLIALADQSGLPFPAVPWLLAAGALAAGGKLNLFAAICWAALGSLVADLIWFYVGQRGKRRIFRVFPDLESRKRSLPRKLHTRLILRGVRVLTAAKFLPFGTLVPLRAGALEVGLSRFFLIDAFCSVVYAAVYLVSGFIFHSQLERVVASMRKLGVLALLLLLFTVGAYLGCVIFKLSSKRRHHLNESTLPSPIDGGPSEIKESRAARTSALVQQGNDLQPHER